MTVSAERAWFSSATLQVQVSLLHQEYCMENCSSVCYVGYSPEVDSMDGHLWPQSTPGMLIRTEACFQLKVSLIFQKMTIWSQFLICRVPFCPLRQKFFLFTLNYEAVVLALLSSISDLNGVAFYSVLHLWYALSIYMWHLFMFIPYRLILCFQVRWWIFFQRL